MNKKSNVPRQKQHQAKQKRTQEKRESTNWGLYGIDYDDIFACIIGFTSGGAPYGLTWEEMNEINQDNSQSNIDDEEIPF